jgi:deoxyuridine 5'-triphosphate nucleotidohydrolase
LKKLFKKIEKSTNDLPFLSIIKRLQRSNDKHKNSETKDQYIVDSMLIDETDTNDEPIRTTTTPSPVYQNTQTGQDDDDPSTPKFLENDWICNDDNRWYPPDEPNIIKATINKTSIENVPLPGQNDSGANRIVTDNMNNLTNIKIIDPLPMGGCNKNDEAAITCTAIGTMYISTSEGEHIPFKAYYSSNVDGTIISPTAMVKQHITTHNAWVKYANCDSNKGTLKLIGRDATDTKIFNIFSANDLWYHHQESIITQNNEQPILRPLSTAAKYEIWHQRTAHAGASTLESLHKHAIGVPQLRGNAFYRCPSCMSGKLCTKRPIGKPTPSKAAVRPSKSTQASSTPPPPQTESNSTNPQMLPGQHFAMDYGFVRGTAYNIKTEGGSTVTSIDGMNSYLSIIDRATRYMWVFPCKSKTPPIETVKIILDKFKSSHPHRTVRTDQGGELGKSKLFATTIANCGFSLELTGADASAQNGLVENPNRTLGQMMRCMLHSAELGPEYWSYAIQYAAYIRNRLPHNSIKKSPYESFTGNKPDLSGLRIFGSRVYAKKPGKRHAKLDDHTYKGFFVGFTATDKNVRYIDENTGRIKISTHVIFDEAHFSQPANKAPLAAQTLQRLGYYAKEDWIEPIDAQKSTEFNIQLLTKTAKTPTRGSADAIGYDLYFDNTHPITIQPGTIQPLKTGIAIQCPDGTYARIAPRSGLTIKNNLTTLAGVIDPDYRGNVTVLIQNFGKVNQIIQPQQRIAQLILEQATTLPIKVVNDLVTTERGNQGFGSTDNTITHTEIQLPVPKISKYPISKTIPLPPIIPHALPQSTTASAAKLFSDIQTTFEQPFDIKLDTCPYDNYTHRIVDIRASDDDPFYGLNIIACPDRQIPLLLDCKPGSSSMRIPKWRSELRKSYITHVNNIKVETMKDLSTIFMKIRETHQKQFKIGFATVHKQAMHPQLGIPQLYQDQINIIGEHLWDIKNDPDWSKQITEELALPITAANASKITKLTRSKLGKDKFWNLLQQLPKWYKVGALKKSKRKRLTRRYLLQQPDWNDWKMSEHKQLNQYESQKTFGAPCELPENANLLPLLWTYLIKDCGTKKARCVCNGSPKMKGTVTLGDTYAHALEQTGSRIFWSLSALYNFITIGADASNAFAEAPAPKAPLFVSIDQPYHEWYREKYPDRPPLPKDYVLPVQGALQGHPESARLWAKLIDRVIRELNLQPCTHEPCLYFTKDYNGTGKTVLFLRQVDDFAVACEDAKTAQLVIKQINDKMTIDVKDLGQITRFNGVDILQTREYIKLYNRVYIDKMLLKHEWIHKEEREKTHRPHTFPIPMQPDSQYLRNIENAEILTEAEVSKLEKEFGFGYRQAVGELIYALVTCRPDISFPIIKLSQYSTRPNKIHFEALRNIYRYLNATKNEGIHFWRKEPREDLPKGPLPETKRDENYDEESIREREQSDPKLLIGAVDSDYAGDTTHRKSVTGVILRIAGGTILYKTKFQDTIAMSSTEAEFTAAADAGKYILYVRSIIEQLGIPQQVATTLYEDNQGALLMANQQQPTKRTRHMDIKHFALQEWVERDLIRLKRINTADNYSDVMTKATARTLFYRHMDFILGKTIPIYCRTYMSISKK